MVGRRGLKMRIKTIEHSPAPKLISVKSTQLVFSKTEISTLKRTISILSEAEEKVTNYFKTAERGIWPDNFCLSDICPYISNLLYPYAMEELFDNMTHDGLKLS